MSCAIATASLLRRLRSNLSAYVGPRSSFAVLLSSLLCLLGECYRPRHLHTVRRAGHLNFLISIFRILVVLFRGGSWPSRCFTFPSFGFLFQIFWFSTSCPSFPWCCSPFQFSKLVSFPIFTSVKFSTLLVHFSTVLVQFSNLLVQFSDPSFSPGFRFVMLLVFNLLVVGARNSLHILNSFIPCKLCTYWCNCILLYCLMFFHMSY